MSTTATFSDLSAFQNAMEQFRKDGGNINWVLVGHENGEPSKVTLLGTGCGNADEFSAHLDPFSVQYGIVKVPDLLFNKERNKAFYIRWVGPQVPFTKVGRLGVVHGSIQKLFEPYHDCLETGQVSDISAQALETRIKETSGTKSKVVDGQAHPSCKVDILVRGNNVKTTNKPAPVRMASASFTTSQGKDILQVENSARDMIKEVRNENSTINWCLVKYADSKCKGPLVPHAQGSGGLEELKTFLADDNVFYGIVVISKMVDERVKTTKFVSITYVGKDIPIMAKATIGTHRCVIEDLIGSTHGTVFAAKPSEFSMENIEKRLITSTSTQA